MSSSSVCCVVVTISHSSGLRQDAEAWEHGWASQVFDAEHLAALHAEGAVMLSIVASSCILQKSVYVRSA